MTERDYNIFKRQICSDHGFDIWYFTGKVMYMSILQKQITQSLDGLSEENLSFLLEMIQRFMLPTQSKTVAMNDDAGQKRMRRLGSMKGQQFIADGHDIDECNAEIAEMFGVDG